MKLAKLQNYQCIRAFRVACSGSNGKEIETFLLTKTWAFETLIKHIVINYDAGGVVQLVRTSACHAEGREFESRRSRHLYGRCYAASFFI